MVARMKPSDSLRTSAVASDAVGRPPKATTQITLMLPDELLRRLEAIAAAWSRPGISISRMDVLRAAAVDAVPRFEADAGISPPPPPSEPTATPAPSGKRAKRLKRG